MLAGIVTSFFVIVSFCELSLKKFQRPFFVRATFLLDEDLGHFEHPILFVWKHKSTPKSSFNDIDYRYFSLFFVALKLSIELGSPDTSFLGLRLEFFKLFLKYKGTYIYLPNNKSLFSSKLMVQRQIFKTNFIFST